MIDVTRRFRIGVAFATLALAVGVFAGCGGDDDDDDDGGGGGGGEKVTFSVYSDEPLFIVSAIKGLEQAAAEKNVDLTVTVDANDPAQQVSQIENALTQQPEGLIIWANDTEAAIPVAEQAQSQGIEVLTMGQDLGDPAVRTAYVGPDYVDSGRKKAEKLVELLNGNGQVGIIRGIQGADFTEKMAEGGDPVFEGAEGIEVVDQQFAGAYTTEAGLTTAENMLTANPEIDGIWTDSDDQAVGAIQALEARGMLDKAVVVSTNGDPAGLRELQKGRLDWTEALCGVDDGFLAIDSMLKALNDEELPDRVQTKIVDVTPANIDQHIAELEKCN
jgi:ribose transport system substrate-binding protein